MLTLIRSRCGLLLAASMLFACSGDKSTDHSSGTGEHEQKLAELTPDEVEARIQKNDGTFHVIDNNPKEVFDKGHLPGATWVATSEVTAATLPGKKDDSYVFYCANEH